MFLCDVQSTRVEFLMILFLVHNLDNNRGPHILVLMFMEAFHLFHQRYALHSLFFVFFVQLTSSCEGYRLILCVICGVWMLIRVCGGFEFEDVRKIAAELTGRLLPDVSSHSVDHSALFERRAIFS